MHYPWSDALTENDRQVIGRGGYGDTRPLGRRPAVLVIDAQVNYVGENKPTLEQIDRYPSGVGQRAWQALPAIQQLVEAARANDVPLVFTMMCQSQLRGAERIEAMGFYHNVRRPPDFMTADDPGRQIVSQLSTRPDLNDIILTKDQPSAFFGTPLTSYLLKLRVDTVLLTGGTTSGCVRATAVDAASLNLQVAVVQEAVFDRIELSHQASLLDIWMKYGRVIALDEALSYLGGLNLL